MRRNRDTVVARHRTICLPIEEEDYLRIIHHPKAFRRPLMIVSVRPLSCFRRTSRLGYKLKDDRMSARKQIQIRRILPKDDWAYSIRPSFLMPYMTAAWCTSKDQFLAVWRPVLGLGPRLRR